MGAPSGLGPANHAWVERVARDALTSSWPRLMAWTRRTVEVLPAAEAAAPGFRDLNVNAQGERRWSWPRSNQPERITVWLHAAQLDPAGDWQRLARRYADAMIDDPERGIFAPDPADEARAVGRGLIWYWRDADCYMTNYTMRAPPAMLDLYAATGEPRYRDAALTTGEAMLRLTHPATGLPREGWTLPGVENSPWVSDHKINSRIGYAALTYARLHEHTGDDRFALALEQLVNAMRRYQRDDGALPEELRIDRFEPWSARIKGHFLAYILNGTAAAARLVPEVEGLRELATGVGDYLLDHLRRCGGPVYGDLDDEKREELGMWRTAHADTAPGFLDLAEVTGEPVYRTAAARLLLNAALSAFDCPDEPGLHGGIPVWCGPAARPTMQIGGYFQFFTLMGLLRFLAPGNPPEAVRTVAAAR